MSKTDKIMVTNDGRNCSALEITVKVSHMGQQQQPAASRAALRLGAKMTDILLTPVNPHQQYFIFGAWFSSTHQSLHASIQTILHNYFCIHT